jgi:hypothetical protein
VEDNDVYRWIYVLPLNLLERSGVQIPLGCAASADHGRTSSICELDVSDAWSDDNGQGSRRCE